MSTLRLLSVADTAAFRDRVQHDRCVHGGKQLDRSVLVAVASSRTTGYRSTCRRDRRTRAGRARAVPRPTHDWDYFIGCRDAITQTMINTPAHPRSGAHRRLTVDRCHDRGAVKSQVIHFHVRETVSRELTLQLGQPARSLDQRRQAAIDFRPLR